MGMGTEIITHLSYDELRQRPDDGKRYELIRGEVHVSPSPNTRHQHTLWNLSISFGIYSQTHAGPPDLVVEILSPSTAAHDRATKLALYAGAGVPWVWFLDAEVKTVETLKLEGGKYYYDSVLSGNQILTSPLFPEWQLPLHELFDFRTSF